MVHRRALRERAQHTPTGYLCSTSGRYAYGGVTDLGVTITTNNNKGAFVRGVDRMYGAYEKGIRLLTDASPTILDSLIS